MKEKKGKKALIFREKEVSNKRGNGDERERESFKWLSFSAKSNEG
jgi:hypothetical protein